MGTEVVVEAVARHPEITNRVELIAPTVNARERTAAWQGCCGERACASWGERDKVCSRGWVTQMTRLLPDATMREIAGRGHRAMIRSPQPVASMIIEHALATGSSRP